MAQRLTQRLLILGWDAADWKIIDPLIAVGRMPNLAQFTKEGVRGDISSLDPKLSPLLWTSVATGKTADRHGILNFIEPDPATGAMRISSSTSRTTKALWNILTQCGLKTNVISWYASHPAEPIRGCCISNLFQEGQPPVIDQPWPVPGGAVHPPSITEQIAPLRLHPHEITGNELLGLLPHLREMNPADPRIALLAKLIAQCSSVHNVATALLSRNPDVSIAEGHGWDCAMVFYDTIDVVGHHFMQYFPPRMAHVSELDFQLFQGVVNAVYELHDAMLGVLLHIVGPETTVILLSDHGFHSDHLRPPVPPRIDDQHAAMDSSWHRPLGMLAMRGPGIKQGEQVFGANLLDIAPTALALLGQPIGGDMSGRVLTEALDRPVQLERVFTWDAIEGESGMHPADMRTDPVAAQETMKQLADLGYISPLSGDIEQQLAMLKRETKFNLAVVYMTTRRIAEALPLFEELYAANPDDERIAINLGQCLHERGRYAEATVILDRYIKANPDNPSARIHMAVALMHQKRTQEAVTALQEAERQTPDNPDLLYMLGWVYSFGKRLPEARRAIERALAIDPHHPKAHHGLALVALQQEKFEEAADHALRAVEIQHFFPDAHYTLGVALTWLQDFPSAIKCFNIALSMQPGLIDAHRYLASIYRALGDRLNAPAHRRAAEQLIAKRKAGESNLADFLVEPPMGPESWEKRQGIAQEPPAPQ